MSLLIPMVVLSFSLSAARGEAREAEAGKHFSRAVGLYNEADYSAALVEFRRAHEIAPRAAVLYNLGQTYFQLQRYAEALTTFDRYLREAGSNAPHVGEVSQALETLRSRVGSIEIDSNLGGVEIAIDDEVIGKTPFARPVLVSIGRRKVTATPVGQVPVTRSVDVAAGDTVNVAFSLQAPATLDGPLPAPAPALTLERASPQNLGSPWLVAGWTATGVLAASSVTLGILAYTSSRDLSAARASFPVSRETLDGKAQRVSRLAHAADGLGIAAVVMGGVTLGFTLSRSKSHDVQAAVSPTGVQLAGTFQ